MKRATWAVASFAVGIGLWLQIGEPKTDAPVGTSDLSASADTPPPAQVAATADVSEPAGSNAGPRTAATADRKPAFAGQPPLQALRTLNTCYQADNCGLAGPEGLEAHFAAVSQISERLAALTEKDGSVAELSALARAFLAFPDGRVQAEALALADRLPPDRETAAAAVKALHDNYDGVLFQKALPVLQRWQANGVTQGLDNLLVATLKTGALHPAQVVAERLLPFINESNLARYQSTAADMGEGARKRALDHSLWLYRMQQNGG